MISSPWSGIDTDLAVSFYSSIEKAETTLLEAIRSKVSTIADAATPQEQRTIVVP